MAQLKVDENLPDEIAELFNDYGHDALTVADQGWEGLADAELWPRIQTESRWIVTADKEFADIRYRPPGTHAGIILMRAGSEGLDEYLLLARTVLDGVNLDEIGGAVIVVNSRGVRVRRALNRRRNPPHGRAQHPGLAAAPYQPGGMGGAGRSRGLLSPHRPFRLGRPDPHA